MPMVHQSLQKGFAKKTLHFSVIILLFCLHIAKGQDGFDKNY